jgi:hypothetical protein
MSPRLDELKHALDQCTNEQSAALLDYLRDRLPQHALEKEWGVGAEVILSAISRSSDLTKRGVRGIIAEAVFEGNVLGRLKGWEAVRFVEDRAYDFLLRRGTKEVREARVQVKLQRMLKQQPMLASQANRHYSKEHYVVEVQKTRGGFDPQTNEDTRPYRFGEFDILAVNMHPSTRDWNNFLYTLSEWLIPRHPNTALIEIFQPVPPIPNSVWTESLETCLGWFIAGEKKRIIDIAPELLVRRVRKPRSDAE